MNVIRAPKLLALAGALFIAAPAAQAQTAADSGWRPLFNGTNFDGLYVYAVNNGGVINLAAGADSVRIGSNTMFKVDSGRIRVSGSPNGYIGTIRQYSHYRVRVQYMWPAGTSSSANGGLLINLDSAQVRSSGFGTSANRPRSIEVNCRRDNGYPWSLWSASSHGPYISTTVTSVPATNAQGQYNVAGVAWTNDPWSSGDNNRVITGSLQTNPEYPLGQWNQGQAWMRGADSGTFILNGQIRTRGWNFQNRVNSSSAEPRVPYSRGNIGLQSEGAVLYYRNFEIMELDSITGLPLNASTSVRSAMLRGYAVRSGARVAYTGAPMRVTVPEGFSGFHVFDLQGRLAWTYRGSESEILLPAELPQGALTIRFLR
jgi:hypothetical protein